MTLSVVINSCKTTSSIFLSLAHGVLVLGCSHTGFSIHALVTCWFFSLLQERITHYCTLSCSLAAACTACNLHAIYDVCTLPVCIIICTQKYNMYIEQLDLCTIMSHTTYNRCTHEYKSIHNMVSNYGEGNDMGGY